MTRKNEIFGAAPTLLAQQGVVVQSRAAWEMLRGRPHCHRGVILDAANVRSLLEVLIQMSDGDSTIRNLESTLCAQNNLLEELHHVICVDDQKVTGVANALLEEWHSRGSDEGRWGGDG